MLIRYGKRSEKTVRGYKTYIFKAMKNIVNKNICNYINLLKSTPCRNIPEYNEAISECYVIYDKCLERYKVTKRNSFYFYFNKALSRNFYRLYQKELNKSSVELSDEMMSVHPMLSDKSNVETMELLFHNLRLTKLEKRICRSKLNGEKGAEFLRKNKRISNKKYTDTLKKIKDLLTDLIKKGKYD
jgi:hypothetical protein